MLQKAIRSIGHTLYRHTSYGEHLLVFPVPASGTPERDDRGRSRSDLHQRPASVSSLPLHHRTLCKVSWLDKLVVQFQDTCPIIHKLLSAIQSINTASRLVRKSTACMSGAPAHYVAGRRLLIFPGEVTHGVVNIQTATFLYTLRVLRLVGASHACPSAPPLRRVRTTCKISLKHAECELMPLSQGRIMERLSHICFNFCVVFSGRVRQPCK